MKVTFINKSDLRGGAAVVTMRLLESLRAYNVDARMLVTEKLSDSPYVEVAASPAKIKREFLAERLKIFFANGFNRKDLFKVDAGSYGLPLASHPWVKDADIICLNWINQGVLSLKEINRIGALNKPIVWTLHDLWPLTGICHLPGNCRNFNDICNDCPLLGKFSSKHDLSRRVWDKKRRLYDAQPIHFVAVSKWVATKCRVSTLLEDASVTVIPNSFPIPNRLERRDTGLQTARIVMGAARLDDPVKGFDVLIEALRKIANTHEELGERLELVTYGNIRNPQLFDEIPISHTHLGEIKGEDKIREVYSNAEIVISSSHYETFGATLVEGQASGCIPVSFNHGGQGDIIDHLHTGYLAPYSKDKNIAAESLAEGILWACDNISEDMWERLHKSALSRFSGGAVALRYIDLFNQLLNKKTR
jgi:glycosyltransferase involved in cell wall biosynthesis